MKRFAKRVRSISDVREKVDVRLVGSDRYQLIDDCLQILQNVSIDPTRGYVGRSGHAASSAAQLLIIFSHRLGRIMAPRNQPSRERAEVMSQDEIDGVTLKCAALIREDMGYQKARARQRVPGSQICYKELDVKALVDSVEMGDNLIAFNNNRRYHQSETKRIWARVLRDVALAISAAQYRFAYLKLKAVGF